MKTKSAFVVSLLIIFFQSHPVFASSSVHEIRVCRRHGLTEMADHKKVIYRAGWTFTSYSPEDDPKFRKMESEMNRLSLQGKSVQKLYNQLNAYQDKLFKNSLDVKLLKDAVLGPKPGCASAPVSVSHGSWHKAILLPQASTPGATLVASPLPPFK